MMVDVTAMLSAYLECALWSSTDDNGDPLDERFSLSDFSGETYDAAREECERFVETAGEDLQVWQDRGGQDSAQIGHDLWLTRNHHGAGFWDRWYDRGELERIGRKLSDIADGHGTADVIVADDMTLQIL